MIKFIAYICSDSKEWLDKYETLGWPLTYDSIMELNTSVVFCLWDGKNENYVTSKRETHSKTRKKTREKGGETSKKLTKMSWVLSDILLQLLLGQAPW